jgi:hypothetical protein
VAHHGLVLRARRRRGRDRGDQLVDDVPRVAHDRDVGVPVLADLGRVDVGVHDLGVRGERVELAGDPVVEAGAQGDQQVGLLQRVHGRDRAVHAGHAQVLRVRVGERAERHQRGDHRDAGELGQLAQPVGGAGLEHAAADVQHRAPGPAISRAASRICLPCGCSVGR